jgi:TetR/AcrR family tetracycline transcriptional repressor
MSTPTSPRTAEQHLCVDAIVEVATQISEAEGFEAISMRRLADEFGVTAMALYGYVSTKLELLELIADGYIAQLDLAPRSRSWERRLLRIFTSFHELMVEHPLLAHVLIETPVDGPAARRVADAVIGMLREHGFDDARAVEIFSVLASYTMGFTLSQRARRPLEQRSAEKLRQLRAEPGYANLSAAGAHYLDWPTSRAFERALEHLIAAYAA